MNNSPRRMTLCKYIIIMKVITVEEPISKERNQEHYNQHWLQIASKKTVACTRIYTVWRYIIFERYLLKDTASVIVWLSVPVISSALALRKELPSPFLPPPPPPPPACTVSSTFVNLRAQTGLLLSWMRCKFKRSSSIIQQIWVVTLLPLLLPSTSLSSLRKSSILLVSVCWYKLSGSSVE